MKAFTVTANSVTVGFRVQQESHQHVELGASGPHTNVLWIALAPEEWPANVPRVYDCRYKFTAPKSAKQTKGVLIAPVPEADGQKQKSRHRPGVYADDLADALVVADIRGKEGEEAFWTTARPAPLPCPLRNKNGFTRDVCPLCGEPYDGEQHPDKGRHFDYRPFPPHLVDIVIEGWVRYKRSHREYPSVRRPPWARVYLLHMKPGGVFRVDRSFGSDHDTNERIVRWTGTHMELGTPDELLHKNPVVTDDQEPTSSSEDQPTAT